MTAQSFLRRTSGATANQEFSGVANYRNEQLTAQGLPQFAQLSAENRGYQVQGTTARAALVVRPTTTANLTLFNNNPLGSGIVMVIDRIFAFNLVSTAAQARSSLWHCVHPVGMTKPTADLTTFSSMSGYASAYSGGAVVDEAATVVDNGWFVCGNWGDVEPTGVLPGGSMEYQPLGRLILPPTAGLSVQVVSSVVGNTYTCGIAWWELSLETGTPG